mgnify:CR=1 FL=1
MEAITETATEVTTAPEVVNPEKQMMELRSLAEMKHKTFVNLLGIHIDTFSAVMVNGNGVTYNEKIQAARALKEAVLFALDFGLDISKTKIRQGGKLSKEVNGLAGIMVQALDNRMLLIADRMNENENKVEETNKEQGEFNELEK